MANILEYFLDSNLLFSMSILILPQIMTVTRGPVKQKADCPHGQVVSLLWTLYTIEMYHSG